MQISRGDDMDNVKATWTEIAQQKLRMKNKNKCQNHICINDEVKEYKVKLVKQTT